MKRTVFTRRVWRGVLVVLVLGLLALGCGVVWLKSLFNEPGVQEVPSLAAHLGAKSILCVFAHPDDEIIAAAFLADAAKQPNTVVRIITATKGEGGHPDPPLWGSCARRKRSSIPSRSASRNTKSGAFPTAS